MKHSRSYVAHLTSVHPRYDIRIFHKMCCSLVNNGFNVNLVVADGKGHQVRKGVSIFDVGFSKNRLDRIFFKTKRILAIALEMDADLYHIHDPELIPTGIKLKKLGKKVIFDSHEDIPSQILSKTYLNPIVRFGISKVFNLYQAWSLRKFDGIVTATPHIKNKLMLINNKIENINNFPILGEWAYDNDWSQKQAEISYVGNLSKMRGTTDLVKAMGLVGSKVKLNLAGTCSEKNLLQSWYKLKGWKQINYLGNVSRKKVGKLLKKSIAGAVTLHPEKNHLSSLPIKMFEYMSVGIPVIASNFPLWKSIIKKNKCGIIVNPNNYFQIAETINYLVNHPKEAKSMGLNGRKAVKKLYNWQNEEKKLLKFYDSILS